MRGARLFPLLALLVVACTAGAVSPSPATSPSPTPAPTPSPSATAEFTVEVLPAELPTQNRMAIPGSKYCFLVTVSDSAQAADPVAIGASATKAKVVEVKPTALRPGVVGEVWVVADPATEETAGTVAITATRGGVAKTVTRTLAVFPMPDERAADAKPYFDRWVAWLSAEHPEFGITADVDWEPVFVSTLLVVSHYSYWSSDWEMTVAWHNMIAPYDWTEVSLRHRGTETLPSTAFRIDSVSGATEPHEVAPPDALVR